MGLTDGLFEKMEMEGVNEMDACQRYSFKRSFCHFGIPLKNRVKITSLTEGLQQLSLHDRSPDFNDEIYCNKDNLTQNMEIKITKRKT